MEQSHQVEVGIWKLYSQAKPRYLVRVSRRLRGLTKTIRAFRQTYVTGLSKARKVKIELINELNELSPEGTYATFAQAADDYLEYMKYRRQPSTLYRERSAIKANFLPVLGPHLLRTLTPAQCQQTLDIICANRSTQTYKHLRNYLRGIFEYARRRGWITVNPAAETENRAMRRKDPLVLSEAQVRELLHHLRRADQIVFYHAALAIFTCCRAGELRALTWAAVNFENKTISISQSLDPQTGRTDGTKNRQTRIVPINDELMNVLEELKRLGVKSHNDPVLPYWPEFANNEQAKALKRICRKLKLPEVTWHNLRASGITMLLDKGVSVPKVMKLAGHRRLSSTEVYLRLSGIDNRGATDPLKFGLFGAK